MFICLKTYIFLIITILLVSSCSRLPYNDLTSRSIASDESYKKYILNSTDPYEVLGLKKGASKAEIKSAYRKAALFFHPDKKTGSTISMQRINDAKDAIDSGKTTINRVKEASKARPNDSSAKASGFSDFFKQKHQNKSPADQALTYLRESQNINLKYATPEDQSKLIALSKKITTEPQADAFRFYIEHLPKDFGRHHNEMSQLILRSDTSIRSQLFEVIFKSFNIKTSFGKADNFNDIMIPIYKRLLQNSNNEISLKVSKNLILYKKDKLLFKIMNILPELTASSDFQAILDVINKRYAREILETLPMEAAGKLTRSFVIRLNQVKTKQQRDFLIVAMRSIKSKDHYQAIMYGLKHLGFFSSSETFLKDSSKYSRAAFIYQSLNVREIDLIKYAFEIDNDLVLKRFKFLYTRKVKNIDIYHLAEGFSDKKQFELLIDLLSNTKDVDLLDELTDPRHINQIHSLFAKAKAQELKTAINSNLGLSEEAFQLLKRSLKKIVKANPPKTCHDILKTIFGID